MRFRDLALLGGGVAAGMWIYGTLVEAHRIIFERRTLKLKGWPEHLSGYRIVLVSDIHLESPASIERGHRAIAMAMGERPDMIIIPGDVVERRGPRSQAIVREVLSPLMAMEGKVIAVPGNHDYHRDYDLKWMPPVMEELNIHLLRNQRLRLDDITWVGIDSAVQKRAKVEEAFAGPCEDPVVVIWHEADLVDLLPEGVVLQVSGHSHGGQFRFPGGYTPMHSYLGKRYPRGFYPDAPTPVYVSRGVGTTGFPTRFNCPAEVSLLTLLPG